MLDSLSLGLVLFAAVLHATWNALVKSGGDRLTVLASVNFVGLLVGCIGAAFVPLPAPASWPYLLISAMLHVGYYVVLLNAYRRGDLSHVYPLARGSAPVWITLFAALAAGEVMPFWGLVGVALACAGIITLAFEHGPPWRGNGPASAFALLTGLFIASYSLMDGLGVRLSGSPLGFVFWLSILDGWPLAVFLLLRHRRRSAAYLRSGWRYCLGGGLAQVLAYGLVIYAMRDNPLGAVSAVRETSVVIAAIIGVVVLRESAGGFRIGAAALVFVGVATMNLLG